MDRYEERTRAWPTAFASLLAFLLLGLVQSASAFVYWADRSGESIGRANLDGTGVNEQFITKGFLPRDINGGPTGIAVDDRYIYFSGGSSIDDIGWIRRANLDGTKVDKSFIPLVEAGNLAVDGEHIYWADRVSFYEWGIGRASLDGSGVDRRFISGTDGYVYDVAVNDSHVYWNRSGGSGGIGRANLDGTEVTEPLSTLAAHSSIALGDDHIYWGDRSAPSIGRASLDGADIEPDFMAANPVLDLAQDGDQLYWASRGGIGRAGLDGTDPQLEFITLPRESIRSVAVDGLSDAAAPSTEITNGVPDKTMRSALKLRFKSSEPNSTFDCRLDKKPFGPCSSPEKLKDLVPGRHTFQVRAIDAALNTDPTPAQDRFRVVQKS